MKRQLLYLGEINDAQRAPWYSALDVLDGSNGSISRYPTNANEWRTILEQNISKRDFGKLKADVQSFLEHQQEAELLTAEHFQSLLS